MSPISKQTQVRITRGMLTLIAALLLWSTPIFGAETQARDPIQARQPERPNGKLSRWEGKELWAQRKRRSRAQRRRAARRTRAQKARKQENEAIEETAQPEAQTGEPTTSELGSSLERTMGAGQSLQRSNEMQFDDRLIRGEKAGSGAVILFDRRARRLPRLTRDRRNFFQQTVRVVLGRKTDR